jgi:hypothetical protein
MSTLPRCAVISEGRYSVPAHAGSRVRRWCPKTGIF